MYVACVLVRGEGGQCQHKLYTLGMVCTRQKTCPFFFAKHTSMKDSSSVLQFASSIGS